MSCRGPDEEKKLLETSIERLRPILKVAIDTGMRKGEILGLKWDQVDFRRSQIRVERTQSGRTKFIPISSELLDILKELMKREGRAEYLFPNQESLRARGLKSMMETGI
jgi:integrase